MEKTFNVSQIIPDIFAINILGQKCYYRTWMIIIEISYTRQPLTVTVSIKLIYVLYFLGKPGPKEKSLN